MNTLQQNLEDTRSSVDKLDTQVTALSKEVSELTTDVKTILLLLRTKLLVDDVDRGCESPVPSPASRDSQCSFSALSQRPRPHSDVTWPQEPAPPPPPPPTPPAICGILKPSPVEGGFLGHLPTYPVPDIHQVLVVDVVKLTRTLAMLANIPAIHTHTHTHTRPTCQSNTLFSMTTNN